jgi:hypothetical protein
MISAEVIHQAHFDDGHGISSMTCLENVEDVPSRRDPIRQPSFGSDRSESQAEQDRYEAKIVNRAHRWSGNGAMGS